MAIAYTNGTLMYTDCGSPAAFDNLDPVSGLLLVKVTAGVSATILVAKKADGGTTQGWTFELNGITGALRFRRRGSANAYNYISADNLLPPDGNWRWVAFTHNEIAGAGVNAKLYSCAFGGTLAETSSYSTATDGTADTSNDSAESLRFGNFSTSALTSTTPSATMEYFVLYNEMVSLANLQAAIDSIEDTLTNSYTTNRVAEFKLGWSGGTAADDITSGNNDGTTTTAVNAAGILEPVAGDSQLLLANNQA